MGGDGRIIGCLLGLAVRRAARMRCVCGCASGRACRLLVLVLPPFSCWAPPGRLLSLLLFFLLGDFLAGWLSDFSGRRALSEESEEMWSLGVGGRKKGFRKVVKVTRKNGVMRQLFCPIPS